MQNSSSSKTIGIIIVLVIIALGIWLMTRKSSDDTGAMAPYSDTSSTGDTGTTASTDASSSAGISSDSSDAALDQDSAAIDAQMQGLSSDNAAASQTTQ